MWFKQAQVYQLSGISGATSNLAESWQQTLSELAFSPCLAGLARSVGWAPPLSRLEQEVSKDSEFVVELPNQAILVCLQIEEKILPPQVVNQATAQRVAEMEVENGSKPSKERVRSLKDDVISSLLPKAFSRLQRIYALVDLQQGRLIVDTLSAKQTEMLWVAIKRAFPDWKIDWWDAKRCVAQMTNWLKASTPVGFELQKSAVLRDPSFAQRTVRAKQLDLTHKSIHNLLQDGCQVIQLELDWCEQMRFTMTEQWGLSSIRYADALLSLAKSEEDADRTQQHISDLILLTETMRKFYDELSELVQDSRSAQPLPVPETV